MSFSYAELTLSTKHGLHLIITKLPNRILDDMHGLEELESKLSAYHMMMEKEVGKRDGRGSISPIDQAPPPPLEKPKWKMSMSAVKDALVLYYSSLKK